MGSIDSYFKVTIKSRVLPALNQTHSPAPRDGYEMEFQACCKAVLELICKQFCNHTTELMSSDFSGRASMLFGCLHGHADCSSTCNALHRSTPHN